MAIYDANYWGVCEPYAPPIYANDNRYPPLQDLLHRKLQNPYLNFETKIPIFLQKGLDIFPSLGYNAKAVCEYAAIAQSVERILGKDEVASSNLASSSKKSVIPTGMADFLLADTDLNWRSQ